MMVEIQKRFSDFDMYGHVNSVVYFSYFEYARIQALGEIFENVADTIWFVVAKQSCDYLEPILFKDLVFVEIKIAKIGKSSFDLEYIVKNDHKLFAKGFTTLVAIDKNTKKATPLNQDIQNYLSKIS
ncbi:4-hydroxybenzoyl-CoA thioesterase family active site [Desulfurella amilsii]|uniref:4-hydroxybenzoyl-CoA thioesterase family active site n=1 Tax=Desulfurella amilsii TaxID=1562698 RepID=A0A1X4XVJ0_9BACT|nr:thioesterase family protein [Desulfurella amilsii]OSS41535.1 4-hydroxybenzoyl-CoA thioesterase family active site [Desulfurella amilsii]